MTVDLPCEIYISSSSGAVKQKKMRVFVRLRAFGPIVSDDDDDDEAVIGQTVVSGSLSLAGVGLREVGRRVMKHQKTRQSQRDARPPQSHVGLPEYQLSQKRLSSRRTSAHTH